ncbi:MAG: MBL fold metallo-hydrolase [Candidatus Dormibacteraeota bacterium]|nr:MBL fold metallo-hydrolase [Candidatus Dormibacteraeota bacterium]MBO0761098.1 MBL fold metallo-hydrolase [Candidatus Dormibacteraeota bacterium]
MRVTFLGHAGLFVETRGGTILSDPWFNPAYFASWFPFPANDGVDVERISRPDYLYVSHLHYDHMDVRFLRDHVSKETTVILPDYPLPLLENRLRDLGFSRFLPTRHLETVEIDGLRLTVAAMVAPTDGPIGDSGLIVDDGTHRLFDQNDSRPIDLERIRELGPFDAHFVQYSGAIWYPFVYAYPDKMLDALGRKKRANEMARALRYVEEFDARWVFPSAGPPCFLDDDLFAINDFDRDPANTFPDQSVFLEYLREHGRDNGRLVVPGTVVELNGGAPEVSHPLPDREIRDMFEHKREYLTSYRRRWNARLEEERAAWPRGRVDIVPALKEWFEPLLAKADVTCAGVNGVVVLDFGEQEDGVAIDFQRRRVEAWTDQEWEYYYRMDRAFVEHCILTHAEDWVNELFLSCRFEARRKGAYNEYVYNFFKCLSMERLQYAEGFYVEQSPVDQFFEAEGYQIQRRCPHLKADLSKFGTIENGILTCELHGWQFELATGRCLTSDDRRLYSRRLDGAASSGGPDHPDAQRPEAAPPSVEASGAAVRTVCGNCWYNPNRFPGGGASGEAGAG